MSNAAGTSSNTSEPSAGPAFWNILTLLGAKDPPKEKGEKLWRSYKIELDVLNDRYNRIVEDGKETRSKDPCIDELLKRDKKPEWRRLYEAEQRLALLVDDAYLETDFARRCAEAEDLGLKVVDALKAEYEAAKGESASLKRRAVYSQLLDELQYSYTRRHADRLTRHEAATGLNSVGLVLLATTAGAAMLIIWLQQLDLLAKYHLLVVIWFGVIGAFVSRLLSFRAGMTTFDYDALIYSFSAWSIFVRSLAGAFGALIIYLLIMGGMLSGELFPNLSNASGTERFIAFADLGWCTAHPTSGATEEPPCANAVVLSVDFAKLLIWALVAGFSERLLPDQLARIEKAAPKTET